MEASLTSLKHSAWVLPNLDRLIQGCLLLYIFSLPFKGLLFIERNGFLILLALLVFWGVVHRRYVALRTPLDLPLIAFVLWVGVTIPFASYPLYSLKEFGKLLQQVLIFYLVIYFFQDRARWPLIVGLLLSHLAIIGADGLLHYQDTAGGGGSFLRAEVWFTTYLIMMLPFCFAFVWYEERMWVKGLAVAGTVLAAGCLLIAQSRGGLVAFLVELWACAWLLRRKAMLMLASTITIVLILVATLLAAAMMTPYGSYKIKQSSFPLKLSFASFAHRVDIYSFTLARIAEHPFVGIGYGKETTRMLGEQAEQGNAGHGGSSVQKQGPHNILLEQALHVGLPGMVLFIWLFARIVREVIAGFRQATDALARAVLLGTSVGVIGLAVRLQFDQMLVGTLAIQFWVLVAMALVAAGSFRVPAVQRADAGS